MRFAILTRPGVLRVFHCPVLVEDDRENQPAPTVVALLGDNIQGGTYIAIDPSVFTNTALVLMSHSNGTTLGATKQPTAVTDLTDDNGDKVKMAALSWTGAYPDSPDINMFPLIHGIPPSYAAPDNHDVTKEFPVDTADLKTWPTLEIARTVMAYTHQHAKGASVHHYPQHPVFQESNWANDGPGKDCMQHGNEHLADTIYCEFEILDPTSALARAAAEEMEIQYQLPIIKEAETLAPPADAASGTAGAPNPVGGNSSAFIQALTGGFKEVLDNTSGGENDPPRRKLWIDIVKLGVSWEQEKTPAQQAGKLLPQVLCRINLLSSFPPTTYLKESIYVKKG